MNKLFLILGIILVLVIGTVALIIRHMINQPFYKSGMVREGKNLRASLTPPTQTGVPDFWQVEADIQLYHFSQGEGRNVLVIHGGPGMPFRQPLSGLEALTGNYRFHYYDQRGCGKSTRPFDRFESTNTYQNMTTLDQTLGLGAQIADIERIRQILGDEKLILIGHSWGGFLASLYAAEFPERVEALILISPATMLVMPQEEADLFETVHERLPADQQAEFKAFMEDYMDFNKLFSRSEADLIALNNRFGEYYIRLFEDLSGFPEPGEPGGWMVWGMYLSMGKSHDYRPALKAVTVPVLVIHGADDLQSEAASRQYADLLPNSEFVVIENATHTAFEEQPEEFSAVVTSFLKNK